MLVILDKNKMYKKIIEYMRHKWYNKCKKEGFRSGDTMGAILGE